MDKREPLQNENPKSTLFVTGPRTSQILKLCTADLRMLKKPFIETFTKKNDIHPFEDASCTPPQPSFQDSMLMCAPALEFFSLKNDTSLLILSLHSKKRPHCLTLVRTHGHKILDMLELYVNPTSFRTLQQFKNKKPAVGLKPLIAFHGTPFEDPNQTKWTLAKSLLLDLFRGQEANEVDVEGLQYMIDISAAEAVEGETVPELRIRFYLIKTLKSGHKLPRVEVEEMGPRIDATLGREQFADPDMMKSALKKPKGAEPRTKKNIDMDIMGDKMGKVHLPKQNFGELQSRKMKGLKRGRTPDDVEMDDADLVVDESVPKKTRV